MMRATQAQASVDAQARDLRDLVEAAAEGPIIQHAVDVRVSEADLAGKAVVIVGGGMTSAQLALRACGGPAASVTLICRHKLRVRALDCEVGWYGNKELAAYRANCDHLQRLRMCQAGPDCGKIAGGEDIQEGSDKRINADVLWLATGIAMDGLSDPLLSQVQATCPTMFVGGYPMLDDGTLAWPGMTLFLLGRTVTLSIGPAAGEMPGMRMGADRIVKCIMGIFNGYGLPEVTPWVSIAEQLGGDRGRIIEAEPLRFEAAQEMHLLVPKLYSRILPERCKVKANSKRQRIYIILHKDSDISWRFLKG
ncbi:hypothetical protein WJX75_008055 [Coccomyxa subellipsoidea]|uniref:Uncharacterized protein n=1 Tax=Coccomyxa subellipsoidea TaxID=248742 RepID=A0ABR2YFS1_9CHLO